MYWRAQNHEYTHKHTLKSMPYAFLYVYIHISVVCVSLPFFLCNSLTAHVTWDCTFALDPSTHIHTQTYKFMRTCLLFIYTYFVPLSNTKVNNDNSYHLHNLCMSQTHTHTYSCVACICVLLCCVAPFDLSSSLSFGPSLPYVYNQAFWRRCHCCFKLQLCLQHLLIYIHTCIYAVEDSSYFDVLSTPAHT